VRHFVAWRRSLSEDALRRHATKCHTLFGQDLALRATHQTWAFRETRFRYADTIKDTYFILSTLNEKRRKMSQGRPENSFKTCQTEKKREHAHKREKEKKKKKKKKKKKRKKKKNLHVTEIRVGMAETRVEMPPNQRYPCKRLMENTRYTKNPPQNLRNADAWVLFTLQARKPKTTFFFFFFLVSITFFFFFLLQDLPATRISLIFPPN
jgi:hypothetical protein